MFFDQGGDGGADHVGIEELCDGSTVCIVEDSASDSCVRGMYRSDRAVMLGYGTMLFETFS